MLQVNQLIGMASGGERVTTPITHVGSATRQTAGAITLPTVLAGDLVLVLRSMDDDAAPAAISTPAGYTNLITQGNQAPSYRIDYKFMTSTPDTSVTIPASSSPDVCSIAYAMRGVDPVTPFDVTSMVAAAATGMPDAPSITPITNGAAVLAYGALDDDNITPTVPSGYSNLASVFSSAGAGATSTSMVAWKLLAVAAAEDPAAFGGAGNDSWHGVSIALRPIVI